MNCKLHLPASLTIAICLSACSLSQQGRLGAISTVHRETNRAALAQALADADHAASTTGLKTSADQQTYSAATERAVTLWLALSDEKTRTTSLEAGSGYRVQASWPSNLLFDDLIPARSIKGRELKQHVVREGVGAPFVAHWKYTKERKTKEPFMAEGGYMVPVTATLEFRSTGDKGVRVAVLVLHDPRVSQSVRLFGCNHLLAADLSAMGEYVVSKKKIQMSGLGALLHSEKHMEKLGLIALERPAKDRIPVIFVHGLMSRPLTWQNVFNELGGDPVIQKNYQFFFFRYPSGVPVVYSAAKLREHLGELHSELEKLGNRSFGHHMMLIGHSMGGLVSKSQVQGSGDRLWVNVFGSTPDKLVLSKEERDALRSYLEFEPNPYVSRVIFVATPHRGSEVASGTLGKIGRRLVSLPGRTLGSTFDILQGQAPKNQAIRDMLAKGIPTSVDNLSPNSMYVKTAMSLPLRPGLHIHSIIGNKDGRPLTDPKCTDGFVPYKSSHLDGVESELVVPSGHSAHENPQAIAEMRRILLLHLKGVPSR